MNKNLRIALIGGGIFIIAVIFVPLILSAVFGGQDGGWGTWGPGMMGGFGWWWFMPIFMIIFWGLVIWGIVALVRGLSGPRDSDSASQAADSALEVLKKRYARGEMTREEYEEKKKDLA